MDVSSLLLFLLFAAVIGGMITVFWNRESICGFFDRKDCKVLKVCSKPNNWEPPDSNLAGTSYIEALNSHRHYSGLRFVMLTLFAAATSFLLQERFDSDCISADEFSALSTVGIVLSLIFLLIEIVLDAIQSHISHYAQRVNPASHLKTSGAVKLLNELVRIPILMIYALALWIWITYPAPIQSESNANCLEAQRTTEQAPDHLP